MTLPSARLLADFIFPPPPHDFPSKTSIFLSRDLAEELANLG